MKRFLVVAGLAAMMSGMATENRQPVLVELFTSEGCSSCPPADALLERLDQSQPFAGAETIVLSEHVDYWNHIGWTDPYSSPAFSARQEQYARRFRTSGPYTPQMVVDGRLEFVGSDGRSLEQAMRSELKVAKAAVRIEEAGGATFVAVDALPAGTARKANVYVAYAQDSGTSDVIRGENKGRRLRHVAIVKELKQVGSVDDRAGFRQEVPAQKGMRLIAFVQEGTSGPVWGAAMRASGK